MMTMMTLIDQNQLIKEMIIIIIVIICDISVFFENYLVILFNHKTPRSLLSLFTPKKNKEILREVQYWN